MTGIRFSMEDESNLLNIDQVAEVLGLTREAIYARRSAGAFPPAIRLGNVLRWTPADIDTWVNERKEVSP